MHTFLFLKEFIKNWRKVGSVAPSSPFLAEKMLAPIDFEKAKTIVELGPGSGVFTRELLKRITPDSKLIAFETNCDFCRELENIGDSRLTIRNESAMNIEKYLGEKQADYIVSGIPLANLGNEDKKNLLATAHRVLAPGGKYIQFQYTRESQTELEDMFDEVEINFTPLNIPPAFVYSCLKKK